MNKVFMTKRRNDGKIVVCSELTRARGKMKSVVTAVAAVTLSVGVAGEAMADVTALEVNNDAEPSGADLIKIAPDEPEQIGYLYGNKMSALDESASNTLRLFTNCKEGGAPDDPTSCGDMEYLVFQDTDNTTTVSTNTSTSKSFLTVTKGAVTKHELDKSQGIGFNTNYQLDFNYDENIFKNDNGKFSLKLNTTSSPLNITTDGLTLNYDPATLTVTNGKLTALPSTSTVTLPKVYFHANDNTTTQGVGDPNTNLGELTDKAGATGAFSVTAGVNATATNTSSVAIGHSVTSKGYGSITIGDSSTSSSTKVEWVASNGTVDKTFTSSGVFYTKITTTKNGNEVTVTREVYKNVPEAKITKDATGKITNIDVTGLTPETFARANSTTSTGATGNASIAMGADTINTTSAISKLALVNRAPITSVNANITKPDDKLTSNSNYGEIVTLPDKTPQSVQAPTASGDAAIAIGAKTTAQGDGAIALGALATALPENSIAIGTGAITRSFLDPYSKGLQAKQSVAIGYFATAENQGSVALGTTAQALHDQALALGAATYASGFNSAAIGNNNKATGYGAFVIGGDDAGKKDVASNKIEGANTEYASLFYNPVLGEVVVNAYASVNSTNKIAIAGIAPNPNVYTVRAVDITEASTNPVETKYVINGTFVKAETDEFRKITGKGLSARALTDAEVATLTDQGYKVLNKADFTVEKLALEIYDPLGYVSGMVAQYKAQGKTDAEIETLKPELYKHLLSYSGNSGTAYSPYQEAASSGVGSIAFGLKTQATQDGAIAMGVASNAHAKESIAVGVGTVTTGERAVSVGSRSIASGERSIAIGTYSEAPDAAHGETRYDSPRALADDAVAIGTGAYVGLDVQGTKSVALGSGSIVTTGHGDIKENLTTGAWEGILRNYKSYDPNKEPGVNNATLGETHKQFDLGNTTTGGTTGTINKAYVGRIIYQNFAGQTAVGAVSVGYGDNEKRIQNVAAGEISPTSTDAINGSQLYMVAYELGKEVESSYFHVNRADPNQQVGDTNTNKGKLDDYAGARSNYAVTAGVNTRAVGNGSISMGHDALSGMTTAQYTEMAAIDSVLQSNISKKETAENQIIAADKTLNYVTEQRAKLQDAIDLYNTDIAAVKTTISNTTNADELARLNAQLNKMIASRDLLQGQLPELADMETAANATKAQATIDKADAEGVIATKQAELTAYLTTNKKDYALAIGSQAIASGEKSIAIGKDNNASGNQSIAIGTGNIVSGDRSGAFGDPSIVAGAGSYTQGNDNAVGSKAKNVGAFGNNNQIGATATYVDGKLQTANGLAKESAVENSKVLGNNNYINSSNTYVLGSGVGVEGTNTFGTVENSVYLGNDSTISQNAGANKKADNTDGTTTTAGATGVVKTAELLGVTYGEFAAHTATGAVTVGSAGAERRIMNVAAGEISKTSTDAINGSQLYYVAKQAATPFTVTANSNKDTDAENLDKQYAAADGKQVQLGETLNIAGSKTSKNLTRDSSNTATDGTYSAQNIQTVVDNDGVQIQFAEKPEFKEVTAKDGNNVSKLSPTNITTTDGTSTTTIAPDSITVGDKAGDTDKPITISSTTTDGNTKNVIDGLTNNLPETKNATDDTTTKTQDAPTDTAIKNNAATVGDVLNAGWNLKAQDQAVDFVKSYDTVNIKGDGAVKVAGKNTDGATSTVTISVETTTLKDEKKAGDNNTLVDGKDGKVDAPADGDKNKLVTAENIANAINNSGFTLKSSATTGGTNDTAEGELKTKGELINPADTVEMVAGKNLTVKQEANGKITYATKDDVEFNTVKVGTTGTGTDTKKPVELKTENAKPATNNPDTNKPTTALDIKSTDGKPTQITGVGSVLNTTTIATNPDATNTTPAVNSKLVNLGTEDAPLTDGQLNSAATVRDIANMGWIVSASGNEYTDTVKNANQVDFVGTGLAKVTGKTDTNGVRTITVDVNAQNVTNKSQLPVEYTKADGTKVYPKVAEDGTVTYTTNPDGTGDVVPNDQVITSVNGPSGTTNPTTLTNVKSTLPGSVGNTLTGDNDATKVAAPDFTSPTEAKKLNNAATVSDVLNAGWNLQGNGVAKDFVKPYDTVNFVDGTGTKVDVSTDADGKVSTVKVNVDKGDIVVNETTGKVTDPAETAKTELQKAKDEKAALPEDASDDQKVAADKKIADAQKTLDEINNKVATAVDVADAISKSGFTLKSSAVKGEGEKLTGTQDDGELINPSETVEMIAGKNLTVKQDASGKITYATVANPEFDTVKIVGKDNDKLVATVDDQTVEVVKVGNDYYKATDVENGQAKPNTQKLTDEQIATVKPKEATVDLNRETGIATKELDKDGNDKNPNTPATAPTALSVKDSNNKDSQINGIASSLNTKEVETKPAGTTGTTTTDKLVDLTAPTDEAEKAKWKSSAVTVGDIANMGWVVSATGNGYNDTVKNANQVDFVGTGLATVTGETKGGIRTITVNVDAQKTVEAADTPVIYTDANGNKLVKGEDGKFYKPADIENLVFNPTDKKYYPAGTTFNDQGVANNNVQPSTLTPASNVIASMNDGDNKADNPKQLANVKGNLAPTYNKGDAEETETDGKPNGKLGDTTAAAPTTSQDAPTADGVKKIYNNAATVGDVLNAGWNLQGNGSAVDFVKPYDTVNFVDGAGTKVEVTASEDGKTSTVKVNVDKGVIKAETKDGKETGKVLGADTAALDKAVTDAQAEVTKAQEAKVTADAGTDDAAKEKAAQDLAAAEKALSDAKAAKDAVPNKVATVENVVEAINKSGFTLKADKTDGDNLTADATLKANGELINPGDTVTMQAGKNMTVKQEADGKITYATKDEVNFKSVEVGNAEPTYRDADGNELVKVGDDYYKKSDYDNATVGADGKKDLTNVAKATMDKAKSEAPVKLAQEKGVSTKETTLNGDGTTATKTKDAPSALSVKDSLGENSQINGIASALDTKEVATKPLAVDADGNPVADKQTSKDTLVDLTEPTDEAEKAKWKSSAVTVGDIANMGWIVSATGNEYKDTVKNANQVDFVGTGLAKVTGETKNGIRTITVNVDAQRTVEAADTPVIYTDADGNKLVKGEDGKFYKPADIENLVFNPTDKKYYPAGTTFNEQGQPNPKDGKTPEAISPVTNVIASMNDGDNTADSPKQLANVKSTLADTDSVKADGTAEDGTPVVKATNGNYYAADTKMGADGNPVDPNAQPIAENKVTKTPTTVTTSAPITAQEAAKLANSSAKNNAATVGDVLNAGWNLQGNGSAVDFVKPYDTVNFVDGAGTKVEVTTDGQVSNVKVNVDAGKVTTVTKADPTSTADAPKPAINTGKVAGPIETALKAANKTDDQIKEITDKLAALNAAKEALANNKDDTKKAELEAAVTAKTNELTTALGENSPVKVEDLAKLENKVATAQDIANAINNTGFTLKADKTDGDNLTAETLKDGELINPGDTVTMQAGKNMTVKQEADGKVTYATKDDVEFNTVQVGGKVDDQGNKLVKVGDNYYKETDLTTDGKPKENAQPVENANVKDAPSVVFSADKGIATKELDKNGNDKNPNTPATAPTALSVKDSNNKDSQINGIASSLNTKEVETKPAGTTGTTTTDKLVDLTYPKLKDNPTEAETAKYNEDKAKWESSAVTVGDIANMGWIVSASGNEYTDTVKNANKVDFKGENGISVTGKTTADGVREITVSLEKGEVVKSNEFKVTVTETGADGQPTDKVVDAIKVDDKYYAKADIDPTTGKPFDGKNPLTPKKGAGNKDIVENKGSNFVTGNAVADAIQESGFTVGKQTDTSAVTFDNKDEKVNPDDNLKFADGKGTVVSTGTVKKLDEKGEVSTTTVVKVDIDQGDMDADGGKLIDKILDDAEKAVEEKQAIVKDLAANPDNINDLIKAANDLKAAQDALAKLEEALDPDTAAAREKVTAAENALKQLSKEENPNVNDLIKAAKDVENARNELTKAKDAAPNKVATVADVVEAVNKTGFTLKTSANGGVKISGNDELINPADTIDMAAGKNLTVKQDANGKVTYATAENVNFTSVQFGDKGPKIDAVDAKDDKGNPVKALNVNGSKITGVAKGNITKNSTDAVNGSQIYALTGGAETNVVDVTVTNPKTGEKKVIKDVIVDKDGNPALVTYNVDEQGEYIQNSVISAINHMNTQGIKYFHTRDGSNRNTDDQQFNGEDSRATGKFSTAIGYKAHAKGDNAVAFGNNAVAGEDGVAIGHGAVASGKQSISIGTGNKVTGNHSGAIGGPSVIDADNSYSMGNNNVIAQGQTDVFALGNNVKNTTSNSVFLGSNSGYVAASETTAGAGALESQVTGGVFNAYAGGKASEVKGVVSVGNVNSDGTMETRRIQNVAPGLISEKSTDAINGSQLYSLVANQNAQIGDIYNKMDREHKGLRAGIAGAAALAGIPEVHVAGRSMIAASASAYKSENAIAVGYSRLSDNSKIKLKLTGSANTRGDVMGTVGVGYMW